MYQSPIPTNHLITSNFKFALQQNNLTSWLVRKIWIQQWQHGKEPLWCPVWKVRLNFGLHRLNGRNLVYEYSEKKPRLCGKLLLFIFWIVIEIKNKNNKKSMCFFYSFLNIKMYFILNHIIFCTYFSFYLYFLQIKCFLQLLSSFYPLYYYDLHLNLVLYTHIYFKTIFLLLSITFFSLTYPCLDLHYLFLDIVSWFCLCLQYLLIFHYA